MLVRIWLGVLLLACCPAWCQVDTSSPQSANASDSESQLQVPAPVSGQPYSSEFAGDTEANYWSGSIALSSAYSSNLVGSGSNPVGGMSYSIWPTIALNKATSRLHLTLSFSPGFTIYQHTSAYNQFNQSLALNTQFGLSPHMTLSVQETFQRTSNIFDQPNAFSDSPVSGSVPTPRPAIILPVADQINNGTSVQVRYQVSEGGMVGVSGNFSSLYYPNSSQATGVYNSRSSGGSAFFSRRMRSRYYVGVNYQYENVLAYQSQTTSNQTRSQIQTVFGFVSIYLKPTLSLSISSGPQHYSATQFPFPPAASWSPLFMTSLGWQGERSAAAVSYSRTVSGGGGLNGIFRSNSLSASASRQLSRTWTAALSASYGNYDNVTPLFILSIPGGHTVTGSASLHKSLNDHLNVQFGYSWVQQAYTQVAASLAPNTNRVSVSLSYQFTRPLQR